MATGEDMMLFVAGQMRDLQDLTFRKMMGEYVLHYRGRVLGFICNDVLMLEDGPTIRRLLPEADRMPLFPGSKDFVVFPDMGNSHLLCEVVTAIYEDLPVPKPRKGKGRHERKRSAGEKEPIADFLEFHRKHE